MKLPDEDEILEGLGFNPKISDDEIKRFLNMSEEEKIEEKKRLLENVESLLGVLIKAPLFVKKKKE